MIFPNLSETDEKAATERVFPPLPGHYRSKVQFPALREMAFFSVDGPFHPLHALHVLHGEKSRFILLP